MSLDTFAAVVSALSSAKSAFDPESSGGGGGVSAETQSGSSDLNYTPVGLESLEITPFEYALLEDLYKQQEEEQPQQMYYGGPLYAENGGGLETLFEDDLFEDIDPVLENPTEPTFGDSDPDKSSQDKFFEEDEKINRQ